MSHIRWPTFLFRDRCLELWPWSLIWALVSRLVWGLSSRSAGSVCVWVWGWRGSGYNTGVQALHRFRICHHGNPCFFFIRYSFSMLKNAEHCRRLRLTIFHPTPPPTSPPSLMFYDKPCFHKQDPPHHEWLSGSIVQARRSIFVSLPNLHLVEAKSRGGERDAALLRQHPYVLWGFCPSPAVPTISRGKAADICAIAAFLQHETPCGFWVVHRQQESQGHSFHITPAWFRETLGKGKSGVPLKTPPPPAPSWLLNSQS